MAAPAGNADPDVVEGDLGGLLVPAVPDPFPIANYPRAPVSAARERIHYSAALKDDDYEYRYVILPFSTKKNLPSVAPQHLHKARDIREAGVSIVLYGWQNSFEWRRPRQAASFLLRRSLNPVHDDFFDPPGQPPEEDFPVNLAAPTPEPSLPEGLLERLKYSAGILRALDALGGME